MSCQTVNSQSQVQSRLPSLPQTLPQTQADWNAVLATLNQWGSILQQASHAPNVIPSQFQTFTSAAATAVLAALTASSVTPSIDSGTTYYGAATLKVVPSAGGTLAFSGYPISIAPASRWFASFQIYAPSGCTGSLTVKTSAGNSVTETFTVTAAAAWQQVWGLVDLRQYPDTQATWQLTFTSTSTVWFDGLQMNAVGSPIGVLPKFAGTQMVTGALAYQSNLDGVPDGSTFVRLLASNAVGNAAYNFKGIWNSATAYVIADEVVYGPTYWLATAPSTNSAPPSASWQPVGSYGAFQGAWSSVTAYAAGAEVTYSGNFWICVTANTNSAPTTSNPNWQVAGPTSLDAIADGVTYSRTLAAWVAAGVPYNYQGAWNSATAYVKGAEVSSGGNYWLAIAASTNQTPPNATYWQLLGPTSLDDVSDGSTYARALAAYLSNGRPWSNKGAYAGGTTYHQGDEVSYNGNYYLYINATATSGNVPTNATYWQLIGPTSLDDLSDGATYAKVLAAYISVGRPWSYQGPYAGGTTYHQGDEVSSGGNYYLYTNATGSAGNAPPNATYWQILGPVTLDSVADGSTYSRVLGAWIANGVPYNYQGTWNSGTAYAKGAEVSSGGNYWLAVAASTNQVPPNATYWQLLGPTSLDNVADGSTYSRTLAAWVAAGVPYNYQGAWSSATAYVKGAEVSNGGNYWLAIAGSTNQQPPNATYWQLLGPTNLDNVSDGSTYARILAAYLSSGRPYVFQGAWSSVVTYHAGDETIYGGNYYLATATTTVGATPPSTPSQWQLLGPSDIDVLADGTLHQRMVIGANLTPDCPYNGDFEQWADGQNVPDGWTQNYEATGAGVSASRSTTAYSGTYSLSVGPNSASNGSAEVSRPFGVEPGMRYKLGCWAQSNVANPGSMYLRVFWFSSDSDLSRGSGVLIGEQDVVNAGGPSTANTWTQFSGFVQAPANARFARISVYNWVSAAGATLLFDRVSIAPYANGKFILQNNTSGAVWAHIGTLVLNDGSSATFVWHSGSGYASGGNQQTVATITIRAGNGGAAPNLAGLTAMVMGGSNPFYPEPAAPYQIFLYASGGSTSATNTSWEIWAAIQSFTYGPLEVVVSNEAGDSFIFDGSAGTPPGYPSAPPANTWVGCTAAWQSDASGRISTINGGMAPKGSVPPGSTPTSFTWTTTSTSIALSWGAMTLYRMDGTTTSVASGNQTITGLSASTTYTFYPYVNESTAALGFASGATSSTGSPAIAYTASSPAAAALMFAYANFPLGAFNVTTPASGGGGGGGGPPVCCLHEEQPIELADGTEIAAAELTAAHSLQSPKGPVKVIHVRRDPWKKWARVGFSNGVYLLVVSDHRFIDPYGEEIRAKDLRLEQIIDGRDGYVSVTSLEAIEEPGEKVSIEVEAPHVYYVQGVLSHNKFFC